MVVQDSYEPSPSMGLSYPIGFFYIKTACVASFKRADIFLKFNARYQDMLAVVRALPFEPKKMSCLLCFICAVRVALADPYSPFSRSIENLRRDDCGKHEDCSEYIVFHDVSPVLPPASGSGAGPCRHRHEMCGSPAYSPGSGGLPLPSCGYCIQQATRRRVSCRCLQGRVLHQDQTNVKHKIGTLISFVCLRMRDVTDGYRTCKCLNRFLERRIHPHVDFQLGLRRLV